jgi:hypothetical protein
MDMGKTGNSGNYRPSLPFPTGVVAFIYYDAESFTRCCPIQIICNDWCSALWSSTRTSP